MPYASQGMIDTLIERLHHALERTREAKSDNELGIIAAEHDDFEDRERYNEYVLRDLRTIEIALEDTLAHHSTVWQKIQTRFPRKTWAVKIQMRLLLGVLHDDFLVSSCKPQNFHVTCR